MSDCDIRLEEVADGATVDAGMAAVATESVIALRFRIQAEPDCLDALRHARRSLLREEATRGLDPGEPSLENAMFSPGEITWEILPEQRARCLEKLEELVSRARRARESPAWFSDTQTRRKTRM